MPTVKGKIAFQYVSLCYKDDRPEVLSNLSFTIQAGAFIDIIRPSCSGKSTLTGLLQYLYRPQKGSILPDGMDIAILDTNALRHSMGVVLQDSILFVGSILDNITLCVSQATQDQMIQAATPTGADGIVNALPQGYQTHIGEKGNGLSGGQCQCL